MKFSVLMSVYKNENPEYFKLAVESVLNGTVKPDEVVLVRDGEVPPELQSVIDYYVSDNPVFTYIPLSENGGLGNALKIGTEKARCDLIARMDTDDICVQNRFELQLKFFEEHPEVSVCGGQISEFTDSPENPIAKRKVKLSHEDICRFLKGRCPFNHMTVMFKKQAVLDAGNYQHFPLMEDYYLWCRMYLNGAIFANLDEVLVNARVGSDMYKRRGGYKYFKSGYALEKFKLKNKIIGKFEFLKRTAMRFIVQVLMPNGLRGWVLKTFCRKKV